MNYVYRSFLIKEKYHVGYYYQDPENDNQWSFYQESEHDTKAQAAKRVHYLNGGTTVAINKLTNTLKTLLDQSK